MSVSPNTVNEKQQNRQRNGRHQRMKSLSEVETTIFAFSILLGRGYEGIENG
jgi:hypothetical protein